MSDVVARTGRHRQRYENEYRLVAGCIPYRLKESEEEPTCSLEDRLEVLMVSTPNREDLVFPKGGWENDETVEDAACREALEEAGVRGIIDKSLGEWIFRSKSRQNSCSLEGSCKGYMFTLRVTEEYDSWPEKDSHGRHWIPIMDAFKYCRYPWMREALEKCLRVFSEESRPSRQEVVADIPPPLIPEVSEHHLRSPGCYLKSSTAKPSTEPVNALC